MKRFQEFSLPPQVGIDWVFTRSLGLHILNLDHPKMLRRRGCGEQLLILVIKYRSHHYLDCHRGVEYCCAVVVLLDGSHRVEQNSLEHWRLEVGWQFTSFDNEFHRQSCGEKRTIPEMHLAKVRLLEFYCRKLRYLRHIKGHVLM